jgi:hypothetical protein
VLAAALWICPAHDDELLAIEALGLDSDPSIARSVRPIGTL